MYNKTVHLDESDLEEKFNTCPFCFSNKNKIIGVIQENPLVNAVSCLNCHLGYADKQPTQKFLNEYYSNYYGKDRNTTIKGALIAKHLKSYIKGVTSIEQYNMLDFGGGDGSISYSIATEILKKNSKTTVHIYVIDPNFTKLNDTNKKITIHHLPSIESIPSHLQFDFVMASAVLEHVKNPREILIQLLKKMNINGRFYIRTPYIFPIKSLFHRIGMNISMSYPGHLFDMGNKFWNLALRTVNQESEYEIFNSRTSLVETTLKKKFLRTMAAYILKFPSKIFKNHYHFVGGWEVLLVKTKYNK